MIINQQEYAKMMDVTKQYISRLLKDKKDLPGVKNKFIHGRAFILDFDDTTNIEEAKKTFKKHKCG